MELTKETIEAQIKEKQEASQKVSNLIETLKDSRSRLLGQIDYLRELLSKDPNKETTVLK
jgi:hypothetical protein